MALDEPMTSAEPQALAVPVAPGAELERVATGAAWSEGPLWMPDEQVVRWSDIPGNRILAYDVRTGQTRVHRSDVEFTNGRALAADGSVVQCSHGRRAVERERDGEVETLVDRYGGHRLNSPNDVAIHSDGSIWFTDPDYGIVQPNEGHPGVTEYGDHVVFRYDPATGAVPVVIDVERPNGIAFSPDESVVYVTDTSLVLGAGTQHCIRAYDVRGRRAKNGRVLAVVEPGVADGIAVDVEGRVWASSASGVQVYTPDGTRLGQVAVPEVVGNVCFGGTDLSDLYIAATTSLYRIRTTTVGSAR